MKLVVTGAAGVPLDAGLQAQWDWAANRVAAS